MTSYYQAPPNPLVLKKIQTTSTFVFSDPDRLRDVCESAFLPVLLSQVGHLPQPRRDLLAGDDAAAGRVRRLLACGNRGC